MQNAISSQSFILTGGEKEESGKYEATRVRNQEKL